MKKKNLNKRKKIMGIIAPSGPAPLFELEYSCERLSQLGYEVYVHEQVERIQTFYAGSDEERAQAIIDLAIDEEIEVLYAARGGYGVVRVLEYLEDFTREYGIPKPKTLVGYSDITLLLDYVAKNWGWRVIHAPMPATQTFAKLKDKELTQILDLIDHEQKELSYNLKTLYCPSGFKSKSYPLLGGNLAMIASVIGTPYEMIFDGAYLLIEEVMESPYRIDRLIQQLYQSGGLAGVKGIVLGTFTSCEDSTIKVWSKLPKALPSKLKSSSIPQKPLRKLLNPSQVMTATIVELARSLQIPVWSGLKVGHGVGIEPIELFRTYQIKSDSKKAKMKG